VNTSRCGRFLLSQSTNAAHGSPRVAAAIGGIHAAIK
jgi:hypothetical protein